MNNEIFVDDIKIVSEPPEMLWHPWEKPRKKRPKKPKKPSGEIGLFPKDLFPDSDK